MVKASPPLLYNSFKGYKNTICGIWSAALGAWSTRNEAQRSWGRKNRIFEIWKLESFAHFLPMFAHQLVFFAHVQFLRYEFSKKFENFRKSKISLFSKFFFFKSQ